MISQIELGKIALSEKKYNEALEYFSAAKSYPDNLGEGKLAQAKENDIDFYLGCVYEAEGNTKKSQHYFQKASIGDSEPSDVFFYNDQQPDKIFYKGLALSKLQKIDEANYCFHKLIDYGSKHLNDYIRIDYFAVSLPDLLIWEEDLNHRNKINCYYLQGLGYLGLGNGNEALSFLQKTIESDINHIGAQIHLVMASKQLSIINTI